MRLFKCGTCKGEGGWQDYVESWALPYQECPVCDGTGRIGLVELFWLNAPVRFIEWYGDWRYPIK